jgi:hypothetical protein
MASWLSKPIAIALWSATVRMLVTVCYDWFAKRFRSPNVVSNPALHAPLLKDAWNRNATKAKRSRIGVHLTFKELLKIKVVASLT